MLMKTLKYIVILILSVFFVETAYAQKVSSGIGEDLYYKNGRLYQDGHKLTKADIKATFSPEAYRQYANGRRLYQSGLALTITGGGFVGVSGAALLAVQAYDKKNSVEYHSVPIGQIALYGNIIMGGAMLLAGVPCLCSGVAKIKRSAASGSASPVIAFGALDNGFGLALKF